MLFLQLVLLALVIIFVGVLIAIAIQIFYIFGEIRKSAEKVNGMLDTANDVTSKLANTISSFTSVTDGFKTGLSVFSLFKGFMKSKKKGKEDDGET